MQIRALVLLPELPFTRVGSCCTHVTSCCTRVVSCCLVLYSCYLIFALALSRVVSCFTCVVLMLCHVVLCCYSCSFLDCNHLHNILIFLIFYQIFTTKETICDYYLCTWYIHMHMKAVQ